MNKSTLLAASSVMALSSVMGTSAFAQGGDIEQVVVSASRIQIAGYQQPTPVSVVGAAQLLEAANADIGDTLRAMPSMGNSSTPEKGSNGNAGNSGALGVSGVNLRNLGATRTLVLFDGQRIASPVLTGGVDSVRYSQHRRPARRRGDRRRLGRLGFGRGLRRRQHHHQQELYRPEGLDRRTGHRARHPPFLRLHRHQRLRHSGRPQPYFVGGHL
jgi:hypothetical protein